MHEHPLTYYSNFPCKWSCEMSKSEKGCEMYHKKNVLDYWDHPLYVCNKCKFYVCDLEIIRLYYFLIYKQFLLKKQVGKNN